MELWDAYDKYLNKLDGITLARGKDIPDGMYHIVCDVLVRHTDGDYLLMQRDPRKHLGGKWEATAGGSALLGESPLDCAKRELFEETGIASESITQIGSILHEGHKAHCIEFLCITSCDKSGIRLQKGETTAFRWVSKKELTEMDSGLLASTRALCFSEIKKGTEKDFAGLKEWLDATKDTPLEAMAAFFDKRIGSYEEHMSAWSEHYKWMAGLLPETAQTLLDVGSGSGLELDRIFESFPALSVTAIDLSAKMLAELKRKHGDKKLTLIKDDYFIHDFGESCFDAAVSFETLHHFPAEKKTELFKKIHKALKPDGIYIECDYIAVSQEIEELTFGEVKRRRCRDNIAPAAFVHFDTPLTSEHEIAAIKAAGFSSVELLGFLESDNHTAMIRAIK